MGRSKYNLTSAARRDEIFKYLLVGAAYDSSGAGGRVE